MVETPYPISVWYLKSSLNARYFKMTRLGTRKYDNCSENCSEDFSYCYQKIKNHFAKKFRIHTWILIIKFQNFILKDNQTRVVSITVPDLR